MTEFLAAQTKMLAAQTQAMAAQSFPPMKAFTGEDEQNDEDSFERWMEHFEERARIAGWPPDQCLYQLKAHLSQTAMQAFRMLPEKDRQKYDLAVVALKKRFRPVDIEELRGIEFHRLVQQEQSIEQVGLDLQRLARKAFPGITGNDFDRLLKGRFYQALLPRWQQKLGAPKTSESFNDLYDRARTLERHDKQIKASTALRTEKEGRNTKSNKVMPSPSPSQTGTTKPTPRKENTASTPSEGPDHSI
jgi:hypothetical protein